MNDVEECIKSYTPQLEEYFENSEILTVLSLDETKKIISYNKCFLKLLGDKNDWTHFPFMELLRPESQKIFSTLDDIENSKQWLNFKTSGSSSIPFYCHIFRTKGKGFFIIGEHRRLNNDEVLSKMTIMSNEINNMARDLRQKNRELKEAQSEIKTLSGIIPICMHCKSIRDDEGYWNRVEKYISEHSGAQFSHGICEDCMKKFYPKAYEAREKESQSNSSNILGTTTDEK